MLKWTAENQVMRCLPNLEKDVIDDVNMKELYSLNSLCHHLMQWNVHVQSIRRPSHYVV